MRLSWSFVVLSAVLFGWTQVGVADSPVDTDGLEQVQKSLDQPVDAGSGSDGAGAKARYEASVTSYTDTTPGLERADGETLAEAIGHYARARSLLIAAIREFDTATNIAKPDALINGSAWRSDLMSRAEELNHILAPQPRASKGGVTFSPDTRLLNTEAKRK